MTGKNMRFPGGTASKKLIPIFMVLLCFCVCLLPVNASAETVIYVSGTGTGSDTSGTGTAAAPYKTINKAVTAAPANSATTILVSGTAECTKLVSISKKDITIRPAGTAAAFVTVGSAYANPTTEAAYMFNVASTASLTLEGENLTLTPNGRKNFGIAKGMGTVTLNGCLCTGVEMNSPTTFKTKNSQAVFRVLSGGKLIINSGTINNNYIYGGGNAVILQADNSTVEIKNGKIAQNSVFILPGTTESYSSGILLLSGANATATMSGGEISSNSMSANVHDTAPVCIMGNGAKFTLSGGSIKNNKMNEIDGSGGVYVYAYKAGATAATAIKNSFVMTGGEISGNTGCVGGVSVRGGNFNAADSTANDLYSRATFTMEGGTIANNTAKSLFNGTAYRGGGVGGGVNVRMGAEFTMNNGVIEKNIAEYYGGGIAVHDYFTTYNGKNRYEDVPGTIPKWPEYFPASFTMNGGTIEGNKATGALSSGGGIEVCSINVHLNAGSISGNVAGQLGGGINVTTIPYKLTLNNVLLNQNTATNQGGGIWACPNGDVLLSLGSRCAIVNNKAGDAGDDYAKTFSTAVPSFVTIADAMLGGGLHNWYRDGGIKTMTSGSWISPADPSIPRYNATGAANVPVRNVVNSSDTYALKSVSSAEDQAAARDQAVLFISGNQAEYGGGIATNGSLTIGNPAEYAFHVQKKLTGAGDGSDKTFTFTIATPTSAPLPKKTTVNVTGAGTATFGTVKFTRADTFAYTIREQAGTEPTVSYDPAVYTAIITTTDENGNIVVTGVDITYNKGIPDTADEKAGEVIFTNGVAATPGEYEFTARKALEGAGDGSGKPFTFTLEGSVGAPMPASTTASVTGAGIASFGKVSYSGAGAYIYTIKETPGVDAAVTYDPAVYTVKITTILTNGVVTVAPPVITRTLNGTGATATEVLFTNSVAATPGEYEFTAKKALAGTGDGSGKPFTFTLEGSVGAPMPASTTASVTGTGTVSFGKVSYSGAGAYTYTIREDKGSDPLVTYDPAIYTVKITTSVEKGMVVVSSAEITCQRNNTQTTVNEVLFTNSVAQPTAAEYSFQAEKKLTGTGGGDKVFSFRLDASNGAPLPPTLSRTITGAGTVSFGKATFHSVGTYTYTITEEKGSDTEVTYDTAVYTVKITTAKENGNIVLSNVQINCRRDGADAAANGVVFNNKVTPTPVFPQSGDNDRPGLWWAFALCALAGMATMLFMGPRHRILKRK